MQKKLNDKKTKDKRQKRFRLNYFSKIKIINGSALL